MIDINKLLINMLMDLNRLEQQKRLYDLRISRKLSGTFRGYLFLLMV